MDIGFYIADLLRDRDEVSLPGLGTFTKERVAGSYDSMSNSFSPPSYQLLFRDQESDANSLSEYISAKKNLSLPSAEYFVKKFTTAISDLLQTSGIAEIKPLGIIRQKNEHLTFEASANFDAGSKFYGLKPVADIKTVAVAPVQDTAASTIKESSIEDFITARVDDDVESEEVYEEETSVNRTPLIVLGTLLFAIVAAALFYFFNPTTRNLVDNFLFKSAPGSAAPKNVKTPAPVVIPDSTGTLPPSPVQDSSASDSLSRTTVEKPEPVEITTFEIIGAAVGKRTEAEKYIKAMKTKGLQARILEGMPGPLLKISLASFPDQQSAQQELNRIVKEVEKDAWIHKYKSKKTQ